MLTNTKQEKKETRNCDAMWSQFLWCYDGACRAPDCQYHFTLLIFENQPSNKIGALFAMANGMYEFMPSRNPMELFNKIELFRLEKSEEKKLRIQHFRLTLQRSKKEE